MAELEKKDKTEYWLRGPVKDIPELLQPAAHALLQSNAELNAYLKDFPKELLWEKLEGRASVGFHIQHMTGVLDRMLTYAKGKSLSKAQFEFLKNEGISKEGFDVAFLIEAFSKQVQEAFQYFKGLSEDSLKGKRSVGRKKLPSTVLGLLFHAAEHSQRHMGQLLVTASVIKSYRKKRI